MVALVLTACGGNQAAQTPTISVSDIQTMAVSSFVLGLTQTAEAMPSPIPTDTPVPTNTILAFSTFSPSAAVHTGRSINQPDRLVLRPGLCKCGDHSRRHENESRSKIHKSWTVQNTGSCGWQAGF